MQTLDHGTAASWFADELAALASGVETEGAQALMLERSAPAGFMAPLHRSAERETYRVLAGEVTFHVGDEVVAARAGDVVVATAGAARTFHVDSEDGARWLVATRVRSVERFVDFGRAVSAPLANPSAGWPSAREETAVAAIAAANGIELLGPPGALPAE